MGGSNRGVTAAWRGRTEVTTGVDYLDQVSLPPNLHHHVWCERERGGCVGGRELGNNGPKVLETGETKITFFFNTVTC